MQSGFYRTSPGSGVSVVLRGIGCRGFCRICGQNQVTFAGKTVGQIDLFTAGIQDLNFHVFSSTCVTQVAITGDLVADKYR